MLRLALSLALLDPTGIAEVPQLNVPQPRVLTPHGDRLGYAPVPRPYTGARRLTGVLLGRDPVSRTTVMCGGAVIGSRSRSLVLTAAHCLYHEGRLLRRLAFLPGYDRGRPPLGIWPAVRTWVPARWRSRPYSPQLLPYDVALVGVARRGRPLEAVTGRGLRPMSTTRGTPLRGLELLGYPAGKRYPGTQLYRCVGDAAEAVSDGPGLMVTRNCHAAAGGSGGPALYGDAVAGVVSSSSPLGDAKGYTVLARLGDRPFTRMFARADRSMRLNPPRT
ncbi:trypsin-like serine protease [Nonomuraea sp. NN258]|uniref:trypsin-like serine peptidase n=1 Tax=Nonomuraea antri TaxID=2730852 RepID=UPI001569279D|nr:trypsin-like serine protease [Nonomuraea antri]NRQ38689.1 trypsin-like serine protease [Nonomuraea antri]